MNIFRIIYIKTTSLTHGYQDKRSRILTLYRFWAPFYDLSIRLDPAYRKNLYKMIQLTVSKEDHTLDVGCGTGLATVFCAKISSTVLGVDSSSSMLKKATHKMHKLKLTNIELRNGIFPNVIKSGEVFDSVISSFMLAHLSTRRREQAIRSMFKILKPNGKIGLFSARGEIAPTFQSKKEIKNHLTSAGFSQVKIKDINDIYRISTAVKYKLEQSN